MRYTRIPSLCLALLLQLAPVCRSVVTLPVSLSPLAAVFLRWVAGGVVGLGVVDAVSGASTTINSPTTATATNGVAFSYRITTGPQAANRFSATPLPTGLSVVTTSGRITGTPTQSGVFSVLLTASDSGIPSRTVTATLTLTVLGGSSAVAPSITSQPASSTVTAGATATFSVTATGTAPLTYQWKLNGTSLSGATNATLSLSSLTSGQAGSYTVVVSNSAGSATSSAATLTVNTPPSITAQPVSTTVNAGSTATFSVTASGTAPLTYQWALNGTSISGATNATLSLSSLTSGQAGNYTVVVSNSAGSATSSAATLTVNTPPSITSQPASSTVTAGSTATFSVTASGTAPLTYQWKLNATSIAGATNASLSLSSVTSGQAGSYSVVVSNVAGSATSSVATLTVNTPPSITSQPANSTVTAGGTATFSVTASGTAPLTYQWKLNGASVSGATNATLSLSAVTSGQAGSYTVVVSNTAGSATSSAATLTVNTPPSIISQPASVTVATGGTATFSVGVTGTAPLTYQWKLNASSIAGATNATLTLSSVTSGQAGSYTVVVTNSVGSATSSSATLVVNSAPGITSQPTGVTALSGGTATFSVTAIGSAPLSYQWKLDGNSILGATNASLTLSSLTSVQSGNYTVVVSNSAGSVTSSTATLVVNTPPSITSQPGSTTVTSGVTVSFSVSAAGTAPLSYQWMLDGLSISGATNATLTLSSVTTGQAGSYSVVVSNVAGSVTSQVATLVVNTPPSITSQPTSQTVDSGSSVAFSVTASGTAPLTYQWRFNTTNLVDATNLTFTLSGATTNDSGAYSVVVMNSAGSVTSADALLTVTPPPTVPDIVAQPRSQVAWLGSNATLNVSVVGAHPLFYQWRLNGVSVADATNSDYTIASVAARDAGIYTVIVSNSFGVVTSGRAFVSTRIPPSPPTIVTNPATQFAVLGTDATLAVVATGTGPLSFQWVHGTNVLDGATSAHLVLTNVARVDAGAYYVVVSNAYGVATSSRAYLMIRPAPVVPVTPAPVVSVMAQSLSMSPILREFSDTATLVVLPFSGESTTAVLDAMSRVAGGSQSESPIWEAKGADGLYHPFSRSSITTNLFPAGDYMLRVTRPNALSGDPFYLNLSLQTPSQVVGSMIELLSGHSAQTTLGSALELLTQSIAHQEIGTSLSLARRLDEELAQAASLGGLTQTVSETCHTKLQALIDVLEVPVSSTP